MIGTSFAVEDTLGEIEFQTRKRGGTIARNPLILYGSGARILT